jgi:hypothetical protein
METTTMTETTIVMKMIEIRYRKDKKGRVMNQMSTTEPPAGQKGINIFKYYA